MHRHQRASRFVLLAAATAFCGSSAHATIMEFDLRGTAGFGLLPGNEVPSHSGGTGGEIGPGILFDDVTNVLSIQTGWGSANGFTDLTGTAVQAHLHLLTVGGSDAWTVNGPVKYTLQVLPGWNPSGVAGGFNGVVAILPADVPALLNGQFYMNVHTANFPGGEIRGNLTLVPAPGAAALLGLGGGGLVAMRRRRPL